MSMARVRCAIYTRKSSEEGLEQDFNSLHAQREACAAYIASQKGEGWTLLPAHYDDGGLSGGTLERPALQRLLEDVDAGRVDQIVVYKIDRLTRSLADFAKLVERLDRAGASFVSVTQSFNTATSMGRLTLNVLLSFAQFEREVTAERIRDKISASKRKGLWMGGAIPFGYDAHGRTLVIREDEATIVRALFDLYISLGSIRAVHAEVLRLGYRSRPRLLASGRAVGGVPFSRGHIHQMLTNPLYVGRIRHKTLVHDGLHPAIIAADRWEEVQSRLAAGAARRRGGANAAEGSPFIGKIFDETGDRLTPSHARRKGVRHRYYVSHRLVKQSGTPDPAGWRLPARAVEQAIASAVAAVLREPSLPSRLIMDASAAELSSARQILLSLAETLTSGTGESAAAASRLLTRVDLSQEQITITLDPAAIGSAIDLPGSRLQQETLVRSHPFRLRRRGVETRLVIGGEGRPEVDPTILHNLTRAQRWLSEVRAGRSLDAIAAADGITRSRITQLLPLAFLAPDIVGSLVAGTQPPGLTMKWLSTHELPPCWQKQRRLVASL
jgi:site-specific DNA recombinase